MHRLLVSPPELGKDRPALSKEASAHLRVLRPKTGEEIELFDGCGRTRRCRFSADGLVPSADVVVHPRSSVATTLFAAVTKGSRWDWTVEKATELGVSRLVPVLSARTVVRLEPSSREEKKVRWQRLAEEAARQSDAAFVPEISTPLDFESACRLAEETTSFVCALSAPPPRPFFEVLSDLRGKALEKKALSVWIGPEGDWTKEELARLVSLATPVSLGKSVLRAETAAICALSLLQGFLDVSAR